MAAPSAELIVTGPDGVPAKYKLGDKTVVGRHPECEIILTDPMSSRRHCKVEKTPSGYIVEDNGSANGTLLNGEPLKIRQPLKNGDTIQIGSTLLVLRVDVGARGASGKGGGYESPLSIVRLEDESGNTPSFDFAQKADAGVLSDEEAKSADVVKLKRVTERLKLLVEVGQAMGTTINPHKLLSTCLDKLFEVFPQADRGIIVLYGPDGSLPTTLSSEKDQEEVLDRRKGAMTKVKFRNANSQDNEIKLSRTIVNRIRKERQSVLVSDASGGDAAGLSLAKFEIKSLMACPLLIDKDDLGLIQLETKSRLQAFNPDDLGVLTAVAGQVAVVIRNAELALNAAVAAAQRENLSRFLSPNLVEEVLKGNLSVQLGGTEKKGTIFFSDIVSFTKLAAKMQARDVVTLLNRYFTVMQNIIFRRGGSIDKCAGDNIMAHWGVVGDQADFTAQAVCASVEMQNALFTFNRDEARKKEIVLPSVPLGHGLGLNTGIVCAGNIGSDRKIEFTVIGDAVNLSARIEAMAGRFQTFIGEPTWTEVKDRVFAIRMPDLPAKNVDHLLPVYSIRGIVPPKEGAPVQEGPLPVNDLLFSLPCVLEGADFKVPGMVTRIARGNAGGTRVYMQSDREVPVGTQVKLAWDVPEVPSLPALDGEVERWMGLEEPKSSATQRTTPNLAATMAPTEPDYHAKGGTAVLPVGLPPGTIVLKVAALPEGLSEWRPGTLLKSDLKSHEEIVRA